VAAGVSMQLTTSLDRSGVDSAAGRLTPLVLFAAAALLYAVNLDRLPHPDEYYHILAARGLVETGEPRIAEGLYNRVFLHTWLVSKSFALFGESFAAARLPSVLAMAGLVALLFAWLRREAGSPAAWIGAGLFAVSPFAVDIAQFCRFYALGSRGPDVSGNATPRARPRRNPSADPFPPRSSLTRAALGSSCSARSRCPSLRA
jgi:Dolichyl-phosphate-mannose-protein mannosyltransferase